MHVRLWFYVCGLWAMGWLLCSILGWQLQGKLVSEMLQFEAVLHAKVERLQPIVATNSRMNRSSESGGI